jgi:hypothetical protein
MYKPKNNEDECITDDVSAPTNILPRAKDLTPEDILDDVVDICEMRCEYNRELISYFLSTSTPLSEKKERFESLYYPGIIKERYENAKDAFKKFSKDCTDDLRCFYHLLSTITQYKEKKLPSNFPIFFELSDSIKILLTERMNLITIRGGTISQEDTDTSETPTLMHLLKMLKPQIESTIEEKFKASYTFINNLSGIGYVAKMEAVSITKYYNQITADQNALTEIIQKTQSDKFIKKTNSALFSKISGKFFQAQMQLISHLNKAGFLQQEIYSTNEEERAMTLQCSSHAQSPTYNGVFTRKFFYKWLDLKNKCIKILESVKPLFSTLNNLIEQVEKSDNISALTFATPEPAKVVEEDDLNEKEEKSTQDIPSESSLQSEMEQDDLSASDILQIYAEFRAKKLKQRNHNPFEEETKQIADNIQYITSADYILTRLKQDMQAEHLDTLESVFTTPVPHYCVTWKKLENLIEKCGGYIDNDTGSSRRIIRLHSLNALVDINQRGVHQSHQSGHNTATVSRWTVKIFREALERAGITEEIVKTLAEQTQSSYKTSKP